MPNTEKLLRSRIKALVYKSRPPGGDGCVMNPDTLAPTAAPLCGIFAVTDSRAPGGQEALSSGFCKTRSEPVEVSWMPPDVFVNVSSLKSAIGQAENTEAKICCTFG